MVRRIEPHERRLQFDRRSPRTPTNHGHDQPWDRWRHPRLVRPEQQHRSSGKAGDGRIRNSSWFHLRHHGRPRCDQMGFLFRLLAATGPDQPIAIRRANILSLTRIHDPAGTSSSHELQHRPRLHCGLDRRERRTGHPTRLSIPEQRRIRTCVE